MFKLLSISVLIFSSTFGFSQKDLFSAARNGNTKWIKKVCKKDVTKVNSTNENGHSLLILAAYNNQIETVKYLLDTGADVNYKMSMGSALHAASFKGFDTIIQLLIENKVDINATDDNGATALHYATLGKHVNCVEVLLSNKANFNIKDNTGKTALDYAKEFNHPDLISQLNKQT